MGRCLESSKDFSFEDIMFGANQTGTPEAPVETHINAGNPQNTVNTEAQNQIESDNQPAENKNDEKRFEYWQSQAMKAQNELNNLQRTWGPAIQQMQQPNAQQPIQPGAPVANAHSNPETVQQPAQEEFPAPPERPSKPRGFSRAEALEDPQSDSGRYMEDVDAWREEMDEYNSLKTEYHNALVQEKMEALENQLKKRL